MDKVSSLKKIVGSLLVVGFEGTKLTESCQNFLSQWDLGGVILFKRNIESLEQVAGLNEAIYAHSRVTPIVSVDHEGGAVFRMPEPFTLFPAMGKIAEKFSGDAGRDFAREVGVAFGEELRAVGFNVDYAPVLDVNSNPDNPVIGERAFGADPAMVCELAFSFWEGLESTGMLGCGKHFPGHGDTTEDSHHTLPKVTKSLAELKQMELVPFQRAAELGVPLLMTAHVVYPALDPDWPATLSEKILSDLLKQQMGYSGLIASDDLFMKGIADQWSLEEAAERFLRVGGDLLLLCHQESAQRQVAAHLVHAAEKDGEFRSLLEAKARRVMEFREKLASGLNMGKWAAMAASHRDLAAKLG